MLVGREGTEGQGRAGRAEPTEGQQTPHAPHPPLSHRHLALNLSPFGAGLPGPGDTRPSRDLGPVHTHRAFQTRDMFIIAASDILLNTKEISPIYQSFTNVSVPFAVREVRTPAESLDGHKNERLSPG